MKDTSSRLHKTYFQQLTPYLEQVLQGIKKEQLQSKYASRSPQKSPNNHHNIMMWAAFCTAFFGFLRCSKFTVPSSNGFEPVTHLSLKDIALDNKTSPSLVRINIKESKLILSAKAFIYSGGVQVTIYAQRKHSSHTLQCVEVQKDLCSLQKKAPLLQDIVWAMRFQAYCTLQGCKPPTIILTVPYLCSHFR